jgi:hypothetical protein
MINILIVYSKNKLILKNIHQNKSKNILYANICFYLLEKNIVKIRYVNNTHSEIGIPF